MTSFHEICGLDLPQSKILATPMNWRSPKKNFWRRFFFFFGEHLRLCPRPWSRAFLSLASRGSVLGMAVLGLGLKPCVLDSISDRRYARFWTMHTLSKILQTTRKRVAEESRCEIKKCFVCCNNKRFENFKAIIWYSLKTACWLFVVLFRLFFVFWYP